MVGRDKLEAIPAGESIRTSNRIAPLHYRLLVPLAIVLLLTITVFSLGLLAHYRTNLVASGERLLENTASELVESLAEQTDALSAIQTVILRDGDLRAALAAGDRERLLADWRSVFETLQVERGITHFYFHGPDRVNLLRVHSPELHGDSIDRQTLLDSERRMGIGAGIELGPLGTFTLRVVQPVLGERNRLLGYIELGKEIEDILESIHESEDLELAVVIRKTALDRSNWEAGMAMLGREADWALYAETVQIYSSLTSLPIGSDSIVDHVKHEHGISSLETDREGRPWRILVSPLHDASGTEVGDLLVFNDISEAVAALKRILILVVSGAFMLAMGLVLFLHILLRRTDVNVLAQQEELCISEERLDMAMMVSNDGIWDWDLDGNHILFDSRFYTMAGYAADAFPAEYAEWAQRVHPDDLSAAKEAVVRYLSGDSSACNLEYRFRRGDGEYMWILARGQIVARDRSGKPQRLVGTHTDITDRKRAEEETRQSGERTDTILRSIQSGILVIDAETHVIVEVNPAAELVFGGDREQIIGKKCHEFVCLNAQGACPITDMGEQVDNRETVLLTQDGKRTPILKTVVPITLEGRDCLLETFVDITDLKQAETELQEVNKELEQQTAKANELAAHAEMANVAKSEFLANMSHEIRTPMNGVIGMTGLLLDTELDDEQRSLAETVRASGDSLLSLINDILDFSKIEAGKLEMEEMDFDLHSLMDDFAASLALRAQVKGLEFLCDTSLDLPTTLQGDPGRLRQVLTNLTGNAIKFTPEGEIIVRVELESESDTEAVVRFSVHDSGIGIAKDKQATLFHQFTQVDASTTRKYGGTGLGLAISKQLTEMMGGTIGVNSTAGYGSEFWFTAHLLKRVAQDDSESSSPGVALRGTRILVVDGSAFNREIILKQLRAWEVRPDEAPDVETALELLRSASEAEDPYALALLAKVLPSTDVEALARTIRSDARLGKTRLMAMIPLNELGAVDRLEAAGFAAFLTKPVRQSDLLDGLMTVLDGGSNCNRREKAAPSTIPDLHRRSVRILIAEDNAINQRVALGILDKMGLRADAVANGIESIKALESIPYDLVLMDVQMPEMDGYAATARIRDPESTVLRHDLPVIAMTAHTMAGDRDRCLAAGMDDYVAKPVNPRALAEVLDRWLPSDTPQGPTKNGTKPAVLEGVSD
jgi:PAS domain S-box-containing protein